MSHRRPAPRTTLFVAGFPPTMRARDLAYEFERMGRLVRCDIPALRSPNATPYAFIEYEDPRDAEAAHHDMHGMRFGRYALSIQFAKNAPSSSWRFDGPSRRGPPPPPPVASGPPPRRELSGADQEEADRAAEERARARAAARERERTRSPSRRRDDDDYPEDRRRSASRRGDDRDADDERRRRYDDDEDRGRDRDRDPIEEDRVRERSYERENGVETNGDRNGRAGSDEAEVETRKKLDDEREAERTGDDDGGEGAQDVSN